ncbi:MAG: hypothetical protein EBR82_62150, partial [Caulobacteraceae bacterium]|nr:hypothetical protein [Caulobacteraceae bacterium]
MTAEPQDLATGQEWQKYITKEMLNGCSDSPSNHDHSFMSETLQRRIRLSDIFSLSDDDLSLVLAETKASLNTLHNPGMPFGQLLEIVPFNIARQLRYKKWKNSVFFKAAKDERRKRLPSDLLELQAKSEIARAEIMKIRQARHEKHQDDLKRFEYLKRRQLFILLELEIG